MSYRSHHHHQHQPPQQHQSDGPRMKTFRDPGVCKASLIWQCPSQLLNATKKATPRYQCRLDHDPYYKQQFQDALEQYKLNRKRSEPEWDPNLLLDGDPWGYMFDTLTALEYELETVEEQRRSNYQRTDVFQDFQIDDDNYELLVKQIRNLYYQADNLIDTNDLDIGDEVQSPLELPIILTQIGDLENKLLTLFSELVQGQIAVILKYFTKRQEIENDAKQQQIELTPDELKAKVPYPPCIVDIERFSKIRLNFINPNDEYYNSLKSLENDVMHIVRGFKLQVCDTCCGILNLQDEMKRLSDHICGKVHLAYRDIRLQIIKYTSTIKPLAFQHNRPHLIHPWSDWARKYIPRSEYEIQVELRQKQLQIETNSTIELLMQLQMVTTQNDGHNNTNNNGNENGGNTMNDEVTNNNNNNVNSMNNNNNCDDNDDNFYFNDDDNTNINNTSYLIDPAIAIAIDNINPTITFQQEQQQLQLQHHTQYPIHPARANGANQRDDFHVSEEDAFRKANHKSKSNNYIDRDRDRFYNKNNSNQRRF